MRCYDTPCLSDQATREHIALHVIFYVPYPQFLRLLACWLAAREVTA
jgi:hypothetical protein